MITFEHDPKLKPDQTLYVVPIGDVHYNVTACDKPRFHRLVKWIEAKEKAGDKVRIIGMGDYIDSISTSERAALRGAKGGQGLHDTTIVALDLWGKSLADQFLGAVEPIKQCFIGLCEGHHFYTFQSDEVMRQGVTTTEYMAEKLGCTYFGTRGYGSIRLTNDLWYRIVTWHGGGGARTKGAVINKRERFGNGFADVHLVTVGHDHQLVAATDVKLKLDPLAHLGVGEIETRYVATGSFLKGYEVGKARGSYIEEAGYSPAPLGVSYATVRVEKIDGRYQIEHRVTI